VPTSAPVSVSTPHLSRCSQVRLHFSPFHLRFILWFRLCSSFLPFFPSFLWLVGMGLAAVLARSLGDGRMLRCGIGALGAGIAWMD
jgi:hypothetical protein